jgi:hypothetical protein
VDCPLVALAQGGGALEHPIHAVNGHTAHVKVERLAERGGAVEHLYHLGDEARVEEHRLIERSCELQHVG